MKHFFCFFIHKKINYKKALYLHKLVNSFHMNV